jgi:hypothetical protein
LIKQGFDNLMSLNVHQMFGFYQSNYSFEIQPSESIRGWNLAGLKKTREEKTRCNPVKNPVATTFVFFLLLKQRRFDF